MSHSIDDTYEVYSEREVKARKAHECSACSETIPPGVRYYRVFIVFDGEQRSVLRCQRCQAIHEHLRMLAPGDMWPDERLACGEDYEEHWGVEPPPEIAALAFLTAADDVKTSGPGPASPEPPPPDESNH